MTVPAANSTLTVAFLGDIFGSPGRSVVHQQLPALKERYQPDLILANGENASRGLGLSADLYQKFRADGIDGITLGDHVFKDGKILPILNDPNEPLSRPANLPGQAAGRTVLRIPIPGHEGRSLFVITVLGRVFMNMPADDPFAAVDRELARMPEADPIVIVEAHMEATSEKAALGHYLDGRVAAVVGTHTHIPTADEKILPGGTAFQSDMGMCGPYDSCIGRDKAAVVKHMTTAMYVPFGMGSGGEAMCGAIITIDLNRGRARAIERFAFPADFSQPPFRR